MRLSSFGMDGSPPFITINCILVLIYNTFLFFQNIPPSTYEPVLRSPSPVLQDAQDPLEGWSEMFPPWNVEPQESPLQLKILNARNTKRKQKKRSYLKHYHNPQQSFVLKSAPVKGRRLIKIEILDLEREASDDSPLLSAQYVVTEDTDQIVDQTEGLINTISKKLCGYSYSF